MNREDIRKHWPSIAFYKTQGYVGLGRVVSNSNVEEQSDLLNFLKDADVDQHWEEIMAFKQGKEIEFKSEASGAWTKGGYLGFYKDIQYRVANTKEIVFSRPKTLNDIEIMEKREAVEDAEVITLVMSDEDRDFLLGKVVENEEGRRGIITEVTNKGAVVGRSYHPIPILRLKSKWKLS